MKCEETLALLSEYIDGELPEEDELLILRHMRSCPRCRAVLRTLEKTIVLSRGWYGVEEEPPPEVVEHVYLEIRIRYRK